MIKSRFQQIPDVHPDDNDNENNEHNVDANAINFADNNYVSDKLICCVYLIFLLSFSYIEKFKYR